MTAEGPGEIQDKLDSLVGLVEKLTHERDLYRKQVEEVSERQSSGQAGPFLLLRETLAPRKSSMLNSSKHKGRWSWLRRSDVRQS